MCNKNPLGMICCILVTIGALNWGLVGLGGFIGQNLNIVNLLLGQWAAVESIVYLLVGIAAIVHVVLCMKGCNCSTEKK
jgi:uncharacterized membrane protein YuzA (DUF378 family)